MLINMNKKVNIKKCWGGDQVSSLLVTVAKLHKKSEKAAE